MRWRFPSSSRSERRYAACQAGGAAAIVGERSQVPVTLMRRATRRRSAARCNFVARRARAAADQSCPWAARLVSSRHPPAAGPSLTQCYSCVVIPALDPDSGNLPPGEHIASWQELCERFGRTPWRSRLLEGLLEALRLLKAAGCRRAFIDGSFVTRKEAPGDFDACWDADGVDFDRVDERLLTFDRGRATQKAAFLGELFIADGRADPQGTLFVDFFQTDRDGRRKGIVVIDLESLP